MATTEERADEIAEQVMGSYGVKGRKVREAVADAAQIGLEEGLKPTEPILGRRLVVLEEAQIQLLLRALFHMSANTKQIQATRTALRKALL